MRKCLCLLGNAGWWGNVYIYNLGVTQTRSEVLAWHRRKPEMQNWIFSQLCQQTFDKFRTADFCACSCWSFVTVRCNTCWMFQSKYCLWAPSGAPYAMMQFHRSTSAATFLRFQLFQRRSVTTVSLNRNIIKKTHVGGGLQKIFLPYLRYGN